jgi:large subunit ribosomal protein L45
MIAEPYKGPPRPLPIFTLLTAAGWRERWSRVLGRVKNVYALAKVKKDIPNWTLASFKAEACELYSAVCAGIAAGDPNALRHKTTDSLLQDIKREHKQRLAGGWARVEWSLTALEECAVVHGRLVAPNPKDTTIAWAQLTVALRSTQRFAAYDARGNLVAGDPGKDVRVQDYWVMERSLLPNTPEGLKRWRAAARITLPPAAAQP